MKDIQYMVACLLVLLGTSNFVVAQDDSIEVDPVEIEIIRTYRASIYAQRQGR